ncbi:hypothetical protein [Vibrio aquimaris]|uniref:Uncharacterized protein n=1 Tax=Vibrio aquimaris TaxID=2587862 RepID=A0A5P9CT24_9VIBR|nr:hypothetical protein [Vibrio aquimaris]QFT28812.1 hypothetical protein FIV01_20635 [Vibrio aquimaris]
MLSEKLINLIEDGGHEVGDVDYIIKAALEEAKCNQMTHEQALEIISDPEADNFAEARVFNFENEKVAALNGAFKIEQIKAVLCLMESDMMMVGV